MALEGEGTITVCSVQCGGSRGQCQRVLDVGCRDVEGLALGP